MILTLQSLTPSGQRHFSCSIKTLEEALTLLHSITAQGDQLSSAYLIDQHSRLRLPVRAIDGESFGMAFRALEREWKAVLAVPSVTHVNWQWQFDLALSRVMYYETSVAYSLKVIEWSALLIKLLEERTTLSPTHLKLIQRYDSIGVTHQQMLQKDQVKLNEWLGKLEESQGSLLL